MIEASAPGSMMVLGEHSVLRGKHALVLALNKRIYVHLTPNTSATIEIRSGLGYYHCTLNQLPNIPLAKPFDYVLQTLKEYPPKDGVSITIKSEMSETMGFGTSAAVIVALMGALNALEGKGQDLKMLFDASKAVIHALCHVGSGADLAASVWGGFGLYRMHPFLYEPYTCSLPFFWSYSGFKTPTPKVIRHVAEQFFGKMDILQALDSTHDALVNHALSCLHHPKEVGALMNQASGIMESLGVHTKALSRFLWSLREQSYGVKFSGSGLGDCAIGITKDGFSMAHMHPVDIAPSGLIVKKK